MLLREYEVYGHFMSDALAAKYPTYARLAELAARLNGLFRTGTVKPAAAAAAGLTSTSPPNWRR
jgi:hypothetical protein